MPIPQIASALDVTHRTVQRSYKKLEEIDLMQRRRKSHKDTAVRTSDEWNEWFMPEKADLLLAMKTNTKEIIGFVPKPNHKGEVSQIDLQVSTRQNVMLALEKPNLTGQNVTFNMTKCHLPTGIYTNNTLPNGSASHEKTGKFEEKAFGNKEINFILEYLLEKCGIDRFVEDKESVRKGANNFLKWIKSHDNGYEEFMQRLNLIEKEIGFTRFRKIHSLYRHFASYKVAPGKVSKK